MNKLEKIMEFGGLKKEIVFISISGIALAVSILDIIPLPFDAAWIAILLCGIPIILEALIGLITSFDIKADVLVSIALIASLMIGENFAAGEIAFIMQLGALLEELTVSKARAGIEKLIQLTPRIARKVEGADVRIISAEQVKVGDILRVLPGETIPVDGVIRSGQTSINQAVMTGESLPVDKTAGDEVSSGTVNQFGAFDMEAVKVGENSSIQRMIRLIQSADAGKAKIVGVADKWATWIVVAALSTAVITWLFSGEIIRAVTILVVFCPCALVLATPTAIMAAIGNATKHGFLVREGDALERLSFVKTITFDKTGTITYGSPKVVAIRSCLADIQQNELYFYAACAESRSEHPLGRAVVSSYQNLCKMDMDSPEQFQMLPGRGVKAVVKGNKILAGNLLLFIENNIFYSEQDMLEAENYVKEGCTIIYLAIEQKMAGFLALSDTLRPEAGAMIDKLLSLHLIPALVTGDHENAALSIAKQLRIQELHANCLPEDKLKVIDSLQKENRQVCMIGDGINDAPALKRAYVGIAMGGIGSDIAVDAADIVLVNDEIKEIPHLFYLASKMMITIKSNLAFSMALNFAAVILAMTGILNPIVGALVHNAGSVVVIMNSALLLKWRNKS